VVTESAESAVSAVSAVSIEEGKDRTRRLAGVASSRERLRCACILARSRWVSCWYCSGSGMCKRCSRTPVRTECRSTRAPSDTLMHMSRSSFRHKHEMGSTCPRSTRRGYSCTKLFCSPNTEVIEVILDAFSTVHTHTHPSLDPVTNAFDPIETQLMRS
jgi:hypothetical protein